MTKMGAARQSAQATLNYFRHLGLVLHYWRILEVQGSFWFWVEKTPLTKQMILPQVWYGFCHSIQTNNAWKFNSKSPLQIYKGPQKSKVCLVFPIPSIESPGRRVKMPRVLIHASPISRVDATTSLRVLGSKTPVVSHFGDKLINSIP